MVRAAEMDVSHPARYCRACGARLARDNQAARCTPCQKRQRDRHAQPPDLPPTFWRTDLMRDALNTWHIGKVIQAYRRHPFHGDRPLTQELVAGWLGLTQAQLSRIESGPPVTDLAKLSSWARALQIPPPLLWFKLPEDRAGSGAAVPRYEVEVSASTPAVLVGETRSSDGAADATAAMQSFRIADLQVGGGHLYPSVVNYLQTTLAPRLFDDDASSSGHVMFNAASALTEMAGWMAHDAGRDQAAVRHFDRALHLVRVGGDQQLSAHVLASESHLARHLNRPDDAIRLAKEGQAILRDSRPNADLRSRLLAMEARGHAARRDSAACAFALLEAESALNKASPEPASPWVSGFDEGALASEAARCLRQLGQLDQAHRQAERVLALRSSDRARSRAFGQLILVTVLIAQGRPDEACGMAAEVIDATQSLGSFLVIQQLQDLRRLLQPYQSSSSVSQFLSSLEEALTERLWLYRWLAQSNTGNMTSRPTEIS
jgi:tetratricopeptide (TPR) repeat protein